jgi:hypothetical protein
MFTYLPSLFVEVVYLLLYAYVLMEMERLLVCIAQQFTSFNRADFILAR